MDQRGAISTPIPIPLHFCWCEWQHEWQHWYCVCTAVAPASGGHQTRLVMGRQCDPHEAPLPGVQGGSVPQGPAGMPTEPPGEVAEHLHEQQPAAWEGRPLPTSRLCALKPPLGSARVGKSSSCVSHHFQALLKRNPFGAGALFSFRAAHDGTCASALVSECHCCRRLIIVSN